MMQAPPSRVAIDEEETTASAGKGITNQNPLFKANRPRKARVVNRSMRINRPPQ